MPAKTAPKKVKKVTPPKKVVKDAPKKVASKKTTKTTKTPKTTEPAPVATPAVAATPVEPTPVEEVSLTPYAEEFSAVASELDTALTLVRNLKSRLQKLEKQVHREHKANLKKMRGRKRRAPNPNAEPSGFQKPGKVSPELSKFLGLKKDELISRTAVTQRINAYCKQHNLQNPEDKRKILPDAALRKLLKMGKSDELTFFNLQKYMKVHYPNKEGVYPVA
uniref:Uncharacterized protein n=1 Tax=viral metagenome TaxID=1070528 RepID=A0A6C0F6A9_9ZZZZ|tara:strand:+ start:1345 stop:2007 length:663 start_codon:yes stop_codon:yes gene_type:complete